jgi:hypothetical protein
MCPHDVAAMQRTPMHYCASNLPQTPYASLEQLDAALLEFFIHRPVGIGLLRPRRDRALSGSDAVEKLSN